MPILFYPLPPMTEDSQPAPPKQDGRRFNGGKRPGAGLKKGAQLSTKTTYDPAALAEQITPAILEGKSLSRHHKLGAITTNDRQMLQRITGETVEVFNERIALKLRDIADLAAARIAQHLEEDNFKTSELGFILSVAHDKRLSLDGSRALSQSSVNIQVNNYGSSPKESLLADLDGLSHTKPATPSDSPHKAQESAKEPILEATTIPASPLPDDRAIPTD